MANSFLHRHFIRICVVSLFAWGSTFIPSVQAAQPTDDFIEGYATAVVTMNFPGNVESISVENGVISIKNGRLSEEDKSSLSKTLSRIKGVVRVEFAQDKKHTVVANTIHGEEAAILDADLPMFLPRTQLFKPLIADPRWPRFSASYQQYLKGDDLRNVGFVSFGESLSIYRFHGPWQSTMELGIQAAVFSMNKRPYRKKDQKGGSICTDLRKLRYSWC